ncbi:uncharacterized protein FOMMEDRAFT_24881 [Fomitiporia mediterranea MF3/22]|uniref:uncharacterized protein n=1 Tax=Fomitiporia mediterranea (strain MF3/22) TaxID=694068 RepID=UPI000440801E|nr:uncharacterized protein FOMMEDRAFT_24881 [Fomitiporia mediterranea MF3/22]EJD07532.1 hypothetical protein FOMMEDRAFT_24881 [Fomitiporia mediterranea MF3/22]
MCAIWWVKLYKQYEQAYKQAGQHNEPSNSSVSRISIREMSSHSRHESTAYADADNIEKAIDKWHSIKTRLDRLHKGYNDEIRLINLKKDKWQNNYDWIKTNFGALAKQNQELTVAQVESLMENWQVDELEGLLLELANEEQRYCQPRPQIRSRHVSSGSTKKRRFTEDGQQL